MFNNRRLNFKFLIYKLTALTDEVALEYAMYEAETGIEVTKEMLVISDRTDLTTKPTVAPVILRKNFPETWIWDQINDDFRSEFFTKFIVHSIDCNRFYSYSE